MTPAILFRAASLLTRLGEFEPAREYARAAGDNAPPDFPLLPDLIHLAGELALQKGNVEKAEGALALAFKYAPGAIGHGRVLAQLYRDQGRLIEALEVVRQARQHRPDDISLTRLEREIRAAQVGNSGT